MNEIKPVAWRRAWSFGGPKPEKVKNNDGRLVWPSAWKFNDVTIAKLDDRDIALYDEGSVKNLIAESDELRKDAERYRWLRLHAGKDDGEVEVFIGNESWAPGHLDAQIDAAMKEQAE